MTRHPNGWIRERNVLWLLRQHGGEPTSAELLDWVATTALPWRESPERGRFLTQDDSDNLLYLRRALAELHRHRLALRGPRRRCRICLRTCHSWRPGARALEEAA